MTETSPMLSMRAPKVITGLSLFLLAGGFVLFLSTFFSFAMASGENRPSAINDSHETFARKMDENARRDAFIFARAPVGMGMMAFGGFLLPVGVGLGILSLLSRAHAEATKPRACAWCKAPLAAGAAACAGCGGPPEPAA